MTAQHQFLQIISLLMEFGLIHLGQFQRIHRPKLAAVEPPVGAGSDIQMLWMWKFTLQTSLSWSPIFW